MGSIKDFCFEYTSLNLGNLLASEVLEDKRTLSGIVGMFEDIILYFSKPY